MGEPGQSSYNPFSHDMTQLLNSFSLRLVLPGGHLFSKPNLYFMIQVEGQNSNLLPSMKLQKICDYDNLSSWLQI